MKYLGEDDAIPRDNVCISKLHEQRTYCVQLHKRKCQILISLLKYFSYQLIITLDVSLHLLPQSQLCHFEGLVIDKADYKHYNK